MRRSRYLVVLVYFFGFSNFVLRSQVRRGREREKKREKRREQAFVSWVAARTQARRNRKQRVEWMAKMGTRHDGGCDRRSGREVAESGDPRRVT